MENTKEYKGYNGTLTLTDTGVIIKRGLKGFIFGGGMLRGNKTIPYSSIVAVQFKKAGLMAGYLQLTLKGGSEAKGGLLQTATDENTVNFYSNKNKDFKEAKQTIEEKIVGAVNSVNQSSNLDEIEKLAKLKEKGIINEEEFEKKKKELLNL